MIGKQALPRGIERVVEKGPAGGIVEHLCNNRQWMIDGLHDDGWLTADQFLAADKLRKAFVAGRAVPDAKAQDMQRPMGDVAGEPAGAQIDEKARKLYKRLMGTLARDERVIIAAVVLHDEHPNSYGKRRNCDGMAMLTRCLDKLVKFLS